MVIAALENSKSSTLTIPFGSFLAQAADRPVIIGGKQPTPIFDMAVKASRNRQYRIIFFVVEFFSYLVDERFSATSIGMKILYISALKKVAAAVTEMQVEIEN